MIVALESMVLFSFGFRRKFPYDVTGDWCLKRSFETQIFSSPWRVIHSRSASVTAKAFFNELEFDMNFY
jgi:hypothetical protein